MKIFRKPSLLGVLALSAAAITSALLVTSCDNPSTTEELLLQAKIKMDAGDCPAAVDILAPLSVSGNDDYFNTLGWAYLCKAGAPFFKLGDSILKYQGGSTGTDFAVIGDLANNVVPVGTNWDSDADNAKTAFSGMSPSSAQNFTVGIAQIAKASLRLARQGNGGVVKRINVSSAGCYAANTTPTACATGGADSNCTTTTMSDNDASYFFTDLVNGSNAIAGDNKMGNLKDFAAAIKAAQALGFNTGNKLRCLIVNTMLRQ